MQCEIAILQLNARADGELSTGDEALLAGHLADCASCRAEAETIQTVADELRRAFAPRREAARRLRERTLAAVQALAETPAASLAATKVPADRGIAWAQLFAGLAAGFLLAVIVFRPWQTRLADFADAGRRNECARVTFASSPVEVQPFASPQDAFRCPTGGAIAADSIVRTGVDEQCEITLVNGNSLRLDRNTEVKLRDADAIELNRGRLWSTVAKNSEGSQVEVYGCPIFPQPAATFTVECQPDAARLIVVDGQANVKTKDRPVDVSAGSQVHIAQGKIASGPALCDTLLETAWVNNVLALDNSEHPELVDRINKMLSNVGAAKHSYLYEDELRRLGDPGVPPLLAYLSSTRETPHDSKRAVAARIVADVAESRWIGDLIGLLTDANPVVREQAARGLERLTGRNQGLAASTWQTESWATCEPPYNKWLEWWKQNRDRYPAARQEITAPKSPPF